MREWNQKADLLRRLEDVLVDEAVDEIGQITAWIIESSNICKIRLLVRIFHDIRNERHRVRLVVSDLELRLVDLFFQLNDLALGDPLLHRAVTRPLLNFLF